MHGPKGVEVVGREESKYNGRGRSVLHYLTTQPQEQASQIKDNYQEEKTIYIWIIFNLSKHSGFIMSDNTSIVTSNGRISSLHLLWTHLCRTLSVPSLYILQFLGFFYTFLSNTFTNHLSLAFAFKVFQLELRWLRFSLLPLLFSSLPAQIFPAQAQLQLLSRDRWMG